MSNVDFTSDFGKRALERLKSEQMIWLTTINARGVPAPTPVWFLWKADQFSIYSQPNTAKVRAIQANSNVSLNLNADEHGDDVVVIQGVAEIVEGGPMATIEPEFIVKYRGGLESLKMTPEAFGSSYSQLIRIVPSSLRGW
jgi:PPOX class probable F420-dependent enzyme